MDFAEFLGVIKSNKIEVFVITQTSNQTATISLMILKSKIVPSKLDSESGRKIKPSFGNSHHYFEFLQLKNSLDLLLQ